jgi:DNA-binding XRE family transcriptional regulator
VIRDTTKRWAAGSSPRKSSPIVPWIVLYALARPAHGSGRTRLPNNNLQRYRENLMMSKAELARKAGLSTLTIDRVEAGRPCRLDTKRKILLALSLKVTDKDRVFGGVGEHEREMSASEGPTPEAEHPHS